MSKKIKILPNHVANKIAAGEVVQRPASVVKELIENSLDANARNIEVFIKGAGKTLIQVSDDGEGMSQEDALLSVRRHATSKISDIDDLTNIRSYGFRGEALSSIAAVSIFELKTERFDDDLGTLIRIDEAGEITTERGSFSKGTTVAVKNLFFNTPARRHFLKSNATEMKHIIDVFKKEALANPEIGFKLFHEENLLFDFKAGTLSERMGEVFGDNIEDSLLLTDEDTDFIRLYGYVAKPSYLSRAKGEQYLFINRRFVISKTINHAVFTAYENILEKGDYPFFLLFLDIDPAKVDINVHPSKLEVKFDDENGIYSFVKAVVKKTIGSYDLVPTMNFDDDTPERERLKFNRFNKVEREDFSDRPGMPNRKEVNTPAFSDDEIDKLFGSLNKEIRNVNSGSDDSHPFEKTGPTEVYHSATDTEEESNVGSASSFIVSLHNKYILAQIKTGLMIIDQHVAHERILYEKALKSLKADMPFSQQLLFPQRVKLDPADYELLKEIVQHLNKIGFEIKFKKDFGIEITGVPPEVKVGTEVQTLNEILSEYRKNERETELDLIHNIAASFSCKTAIKAGDKLTESEMRILVDQLFATSMPYVCPHGRPIVIKIPLKEFDRRFGRTS